MATAFERRDLTLPPRGALPRPDEDDPLVYYYRPLTRGLYRGRLRLAMRLLGTGPFKSLLEVGYGSGILLPELSRRAKRLVAVDIHPAKEAVKVSMERLGVDVDLREASLFEMPFADEEFDALVCLSVLEHLTELDRALDEFARVMRPDGLAVVGVPVRNPLTDSFFRLVGYNPREIHPSSERDILTAATRSAAFVVERSAYFPPVRPRALSAYLCCLLRRL